MSETRISARGKRVLLIADNASDIALFGGIIAAQGHRVLEAASGLRGIELARRQLPDLIVLKIETTGMSALEVVETLKSRDETRDIPIVVITACTQQRRGEPRLNGHDVYMAEANAAAAFGDLIDLLTTPCARWDTGDGDSEDARSGNRSRQ